MTDENEDRGEYTDAGRTPPPLVPPPVRRNDTGEQRPVSPEESRPVGSDEPVFVEPTSARDDGQTAARTDGDGDGGVPAVDPDDTDDASDERGPDSPYQPVAARAVTADPPAADALPTETSRMDPSFAEPSRGADTAAARDAAAAHQDADRTTADAETVVVAHPSTSPSAPPQPVFVPASDGGTERTAGFPHPTGRQREFVQPPVAPKKKSNRGVGSLIALLSVVLFAAVYALIAAGIIALREPQGLGEIFPTFVQNPVFWVPAIIFVIAFVIVVFLANRASWWAYVLGSLLVGALVYFGTIGVALLSAGITELTPGGALELFERSAIDPFIITAGLVAREVSLWTGSAIAARGRRVKERNVAARDDYERASAEHRADYERSYSSAV